MPPEIHIPYLLAKTILEKHKFIKLDVPLTGVPEITWYVKGPFAVGIKKVLLRETWGTTRIQNPIYPNSPLPDKERECCYFEFLYGKFLYGTSDILGMKIIKKVTRLDSLKTIIPALSLIENLPEDLALCIDQDWAKPLIEAYYKNNKAVITA
jgi:hypothetical protein